MKKTLLVLGLALSLVFAFAVTAMAATMDLDPAHAAKDGFSDYARPDVPLLPTDYATGTSRIHSKYQQNTNACASCHAVHTAVGEMLLQWESDQATCEACHNGSLGTKTYNVFAGTIGTGAQTWGGAFAGEGVNSGSMHNTGEAVAIGAAPGGDVDNAGNAASKWSKDFDCTSCHDPHGTGGNGRILSPTVNNANYSTGYDTASDAADYAKAKKMGQDTAGNWVVFNPVVIGAQGTYDPALGDPDLKPGEYARVIIGHGVNFNVYKTDGTKATLTTDYTIDNSGEYTKITNINLGTAPKATYTAALRVVMNVENYLTSSEKVTYVKGMNDFCGACHTDYNTGNFNKLQAKDSSTPKKNLTYKGNPYFVKTSLKDAAGNSLSTYNVLNGSYHEAYRHAVGRFSGNETQIGQGLQFEKIRLEAAGTPEVDKNGDPSYRYVFVCTTCHVAHGANQTVWQNFKLQGGTDTGNYKGISSAGIRFDGPETSANSRLKRMPNMGTCETCHNKGDVFNTLPY